MKTNGLAQLILVAALALTSCGRNDRIRSYEDNEIDAIVSEVQSPPDQGFEPVVVAPVETTNTVSTGIEANALREKLHALREKLGGRFGKFLAALRAFRQRRHEACSTESATAQSCC